MFLVQTPTLHLINNAPPRVAGGGWPALVRAGAGGGCSFGDGFWECRGGMTRACPHTWRPLGTNYEAQSIQVIPAYAGRSEESISGICSTCVQHVIL